MTALPVLRRFRLDDAAQTHAVFVDAVRIGAADHYDAADLIEWAPSDRMNDDFGNWLDRHFTIVAEDRGQIAGFFMIEETGYLNMAFVQPDYRRSGLAGRLYDAILAHAMARQMPVLTVWASRMMRRFLDKRGWVVDHDPPPLAGHPVAFRDGEPGDYPMRLPLS